MSRGNLGSVAARLGGRVALGSLLRLAHWQDKIAFRLTTERAPDRTKCSIADIRERALCAPEVTVAELTRGGPIVVVAPHADDETLGCGGLLAACVREGLSAHVILVTDGTGSHFTASGAS